MMTEGGGASELWAEPQRGGGGALRGTEGI